MDQIMMNNCTGKIHRLFHSIRAVALIPAFLFLISPIAAFAGGSYFFYGPNGKNSFELNNSRVLIKFRYDISFEEKSKILAELGVFKPLSREMDLPAPKVTLAEPAKNLDEKSLLELIEKLNKFDQIDYANPFLAFKDGNLEAAQDRFAVKLYNSGDLNKLREFAVQLNLIIEETYKYDPLVYFVKVTKKSPGNAVEMANRLAEAKVFKYAEPDMFRLMKIGRAHV